MRISPLFIGLSVLLSAIALNAQNVTTRLPGRISDSSGAVIPGSNIKVLKGSDVIAETTTNATGDFDLELAAGEYRIEVHAPDFNPFSQEIRVAAGMAPLFLSLTIATIAQRLDVKETAGQAPTIDSDVPLTTQTIAGDQLADLPDDEDDLVAYLLQVAGTAGAAGSRATFFIDGFTGGRLPPKDQIQQIIIDNNPFSAESNGGTPKRNLRVTSQQTRTVAE